jgi:hypothetical protein
METYLASWFDCPRSRPVISFDLRELPEKMVYHFPKVCDGMTIDQSRLGCRYNLR